MPGSDICYWAMWATSGGVFCIAVQWELFQAVSVIMRGLAVSFITAISGRVIHYYALGAMSGSII